MLPSPQYIARFTRQAQRDIAETRTYTIRQFGRDQWPVYQQRIDSAIQKLCKTPQLAKDVSDLSLGLKRFHIGRPKGSHYIYFRLTKKYLVVVRVVHDARNQEGLFKK